MLNTSLNLTLINTNNFLPTHKRIESLPLPPAVLYTAVLVRALRADLALRKPPLLASVYRAHGDRLSRAERATDVAAFGNAVAGADVTGGEAWEAGHAGDAADVPDFELFVPDCGGSAGEEKGQGGEEGQERDFELHSGCWWFFWLWFGSFGRPAS